MRKNIVTLFLFFGILFPSLVNAEVIILKSGKTFEGTIVEETDEYIKVDTGIGINLTYYFEDIDVIVENAEELLEEDRKKNVSQEKVYASPEEKQLAEFYKETGAMVSPKDIKEKFLGKTDLIEENVKEKIGAAGDVAEEIGKNTSNIFKRIQAMKPRSMDSFSFNPGIDIDEYSTMTLQLGSLFVYFLYCFPLMMLSRKLGSNMILPWIPILNVFHLISMTRRSFLWILLLVIPVINIFAFISLMVRIVELLQKPKFFGVMSCIPIIGLPFFWYLALCKAK